MSEYAELKARLTATPLYETSGEETDLGGNAAAAMEALERELEQARNGINTAWADRDMHCRRAEAAEERVKRLEEVTHPDFIFGAMDNVNDMDVSIDDFAQAVSREQRAALQEDKNHE